MSSVHFTGGEDQDGERRVHERLCHADDALLVAHQDVAPRQEVEELAGAPLLPLG